MYLFSIEDLKTEKDAVDVAERLMDEAIKASCSLRGKRQKIRVVSAKIEMVQKKCVQKKWGKPLELLKSGFEMLEEAKAELSVNIWGI